MIARVLVAGLLAGLVAGMVLTGVQAARIVPLIIEAETYEGGGHHHDAGSHTHAPEGGGLDHAHGLLGALGGPERAAKTVAANVLAGVGFGLLLSAAIMLRNRPVSWQTGAAWGVGGFLTFGLLPSMGLPPELPGMMAADLGARQLWWTGAVVASGAGLAAIAFGRHTAVKAAGLVILVVPHVVGAPHPPEAASAVPAALSAQYAVAALAGILAFWLALGTVAGLLLGPVLRRDAARA